ncbi:MAG: cytochrome c biogenesis protein ResB [Deltaproteobacteria bacterium]|nr:cytochrome c biogenesis protein ResB [Deltaproteobacteria bacterium]
MMKKPLQFLGSVQLAIALIIGLALTLTVATFYESLHGTAAVQYLFYKTWWFGLLLLLIGISVTFAALKKYPWKVHQTGFVITHLGIIILIIGSFLTFWWGIDANLPLYNGEEKNYIFTHEETIEMSQPLQNRKYTKTLELGPYPKLETIPLLSDKKISIAIDQYLPFAREVNHVVPSKTSKKEAIQINLASSFFNVDEWILMNEEGLQKIDLGPAKIIFKKIKNEKDLQKFLNPQKQKKEGVIGKIRIHTKDQEWVLDIHKKDIGKTFGLHNSHLTLTLLEYLPHALVENNKLVNKSDKALNPALRTLISGKEGSEEHMSFSLFPEFPSLHQKTSIYGARLLLESEDYTDNSKSLFIGITEYNQLYYQVVSSKGIHSGKVELGKKYKTHWMNAEFSVQEFLPQAKQWTQFHAIEVQDPNNPKAPSAVRLRLLCHSCESRNPETEYVWLAFSETKNINFQGEPLILAYHPKTLALPFNIHLEKFEMGTDPGTNNPASYQSRVILKDDSQELTRKFLISMNEPLTYGGYTFYQSSYQTDENGTPTGSVLSVGYDPGRSVKYAGSIIMVLGILLMFFFKNAYVNAYKELMRRKELKIQKQKGVSHAILS